jgi:SAM-dependent methyltransferase
VLNGKKYIDHVRRRVSSSYRVKRKHQAELAFWRNSLSKLEDWYEKGAVDASGVPSPTPDEKLHISKSWVVNAVMTRHMMRPHYLERLRIEKDHFNGKRVLEVGSGPMAPILQFADCERHCVDPLVNVYMASGWPLFEYDAKFINMGAESLPYPDGYFDAIISVNALDHVDNFEAVASEMERMLTPGGGLYFEVEYHRPTVTEPVQLSHSRIVQAFRRCELTVLIERSGKELYEALIKRFNLKQFDFKHFGSNFCTWHGIRK